MEEIIQCYSVLMCEIFENVPTNVSFYARNDLQNEMYWWIKITNNTAKTINKKEILTKEFMLTEFVYLEKVKNIQQEEYGK